MRVTVSYKNLHVGIVNVSMNPLVQLYFVDPFSLDIKTQPSAVPLDLLPTLVDMAWSDKPEDVFQGVMLIRKLLTVRNPPIQEVEDTGVAEVLAKCMTNGNIHLMPTCTASRSSETLSERSTKAMSFSKAIVGYHQQGQIFLS